MYTFFWRSAPHPGLTAFDAPEGNNTCTRRARSNTPLQALTLLNDDGFFELSQALASRCLSECHGDDAARVGYLFKVCLGREPDGRERQALARLLERQRVALSKATPAELAALTKEKTGPQEAALWTLAARVMLNLDEFITRE
jgi:hypothetical protein